MDGVDSQAGRPRPAEPELSDDQLVAADADVVSAVSGLASIVADLDDLEDVLGRIAGFTVDAIPGADGAGVTVMQLDPVRPTVLAWAATAGFVREIDRLQYEVCNEGPCLTAMTTRRSLTSGSLGSDPRWPRFGGRVARLNVHSALSLPLLVREDVAGALNVYAHGRDVFTEHAVRLGEQFAHSAAVTVRNIQLMHTAATQATQLRTALTTRAVIDQAIGIIRSRSGADADEAFDRLRQISQAENVKLAVIAQNVVDEAVRRARARNSHA